VRFKKQEQRSLQFGVHFFFARLRARWIASP
jgi:hypothetical protein